MELDEDLRCKIKPWIMTRSEKEKKESRKFKKALIPCFEEENEVKFNQFDEIFLFLFSEGWPDQCGLGFMAATVDFAILERIFWLCLIMGLW